MTNIKEAFENILSEDYSNDDIAIILENKDKIFTSEVSYDCDDFLSEGNNAYSIVACLAKQDRTRHAYKNNMLYFKIGYLIDLLNDEAEELDIQLPEELKTTYKSIFTINGKDLCDRLGRMYTLIDNKYVTKECITGNEVEEYKDKKEDIIIEVLDLSDGKEKKLKYNYKDIEINFNDELDYDEGYSVK